MNIIVTEFGNIDIPPSALFVVVKELAYATYNSRPFLRYLLGKPDNPAQRLVNGYVKYVTRCAEIGYVSGNGHSWQTDVVSFDDWLKTQ